MRQLPDLEYLNDLPVDRDALNDNTDQSPEFQNDPALAAQQEFDGDQVRELPADEEDSVEYDKTNPDIIQNAAGTAMECLDSTLHSAQGPNKNANLLGQYLDTDELE